MSYEIASCAAQWAHTLGTRSCCLFVSVLMASLLLSFVSKTLHDILKVMNNLSVTQSGSRSTAQAPQSSTNQTAIQPGTTASLLNASSGGVPLATTPASTVTIPATASLTTAKQNQPIQHPSNIALSSISVLLFVIAAVLLYITLRPVKITT
jgi:hypothetical protein